MSRSMVSRSARSSHPPESRLRSPADSLACSVRREGPRVGDGKAMVTAEEVARVEVFAMLDAQEQERIARSAADVTLVPGEDAAPEGADPALFAVIEGRIEAVKSVDGVDRVVGERLPGDIFGEVPIVLGAPFPVTFRA